MTGSTISTTITQALTLGSGSYASPLTITSTGAVLPASYGAAGIYLPSSPFSKLTNSGLIGGDAGMAGLVGTAAVPGGFFGGGYPAGAGYAGAAGGDGVDMAGDGSFTNHGIVLGGAGGAGGAGGSGASPFAGGGAGATGGDGGAGADVANTGSLFNSGTITGGQGGAGGAAGSYAFISTPGQGGNGGDGIILAANGFLQNSGLISGGAGGYGGTGGNGGAGVYLNGGTLVDSGTISGGAAGGGANSSGYAGAAVQFGNASALLVIDPGAHFVGYVAAAAGENDVLEFSGTSAAEFYGIGTQVQNFGEISFAAGAAWTISGNSLGLAAGETLAGFTQADTIDLTDFAASSETFVSGTGLILGNASASETLSLVGSFATGDFAISPDSEDGTVIREVTCFAEGTRIATQAGEIPVEALTIGQKVKTLHGGLVPIKWIGRRSYAAPFANHRKVLPIFIRARALGPDIPSRDLFVSPGHGICIAGALIHAWRLVNGASITQLPAVERITYYHIELERHHVIYAENCPAETFRGEVFRGQFHNAAEYAALYPGEAAPEEYCLPQLEQGVWLLATQRVLARRAGLQTRPGKPGPLRGFVDESGPSIVSGWAQDVLAPEQPVWLEVMAGERRVGLLPANLYRDDLREAGIGSGCHGFALALPRDLPGPISLRRASDHAPLQLTETAASRAA